MALSNFDTLAIDQDEVSVLGVFEYQGITAKIYKNWLYIGNEAGYWPDSGYTKPFIMTIYEGLVTYGSVQIWAVRGPQDGIYCTVWSSNHKGTPKTMIGCGVYGYSDNGLWEGVRKDSLTWFQNKIQENLSTYHTLPFKEGFIPDFTKAHRFNQGDAYFAKAFGVSPPTTQPEASKEPSINTLIGWIK